MSTPSDDRDHSNAGETGDHRNREPLDNDPVVAQAIEVVETAAAAGVPLRLLGGLAVRVLTPDYPPRARDDQDMDFASASPFQREVTDVFGRLGFVGDERFNLLHGDRQMYFRTPDGTRGVDVIMNELTMCHTLDFRHRLGQAPYTLGVTDLLLSKLQVVEQNEKDVQDSVYLLSAFPVTPEDADRSLSLARVAEVVGNDWGWWRTVTRNLDRIVELAGGSLAHLVPENTRHDPVEQARTIRGAADACRKSMRWKARAKVGERVRWYNEPEEVGH